MAGNFWEGKNVLVTGAAGMVGSHVSEALISKGANVVALIRSRDPRSYFFMEGLDRKAVLAYCDLSDLSRIHGAVGRYGIEFVFHLGAQPIVATATANPYETFRSNVTGTLNVVEAVHRSPSVKCAVVASSDKAYGKSDTLPYTEDMPMRGAATYEASKSCADILALSYAREYGLPLAVTRCSNIYGPGDLNFNRIIPGAIRAGLLGTPLKLRDDGKQVREYLFVKDAVSAYLALAENISKARGEAFNFGSGEHFNVLQIVEKVGKAMGTKIGVEVINTSKGEIPIQYLSSEKAKKAFGWKAQFRMDDGLGIAIPWYTKLLSNK